jgi:hypothetical protein
MTRPHGWLNELDEADALTMEEVVRSEWVKGADPGEITPHDPDHFARVEDWVRALIAPERWKDLSYEERKILTWGAWTHDIGMFAGQYALDEPPKAIRNKHVDQSAIWVANEWPRLKLDRMEAQVVSEIIRFHSRSRPLDQCAERRSCCRVVVRPRLLAAYLRLADALDVAHDRVQETHRFNLLLRQVSEDIDDTLFHWVKSFVVSAIAVDYEHHEIRVEFVNYKGPSQQQYTVIKRYVLDEIEDELASVEKTLSFGGISSFHLVTSAIGGDVCGDLEEKLAGSIRRVLGWVQLTQSPNSTAITIAALDAVRTLLGQVRELRAKDPTEAWEALRTGLQRLLMTLRDQLRKRQCHNELRRIFSFLSDIHKANEFKEGYDETTIQSVALFTSRFSLLASPDTVRHARLAKELVSVLNDCSPSRSGTEPWTFLLYGCSDSVGSVLAAFSVDRKLSLYVAEGRPKTHYGPHNIPTYVDAEAYVERLHSWGVKAEKISIIPDASIASAIDLGVRGLQPRIDAVILGANGIYIRPGVVAHSAGHLGCAICAHQLSIPVVVLAAATKVSLVAEVEGQKANRNSKWYASEKEALERLMIHGATTEWNPREDRVPLELIDVIITDQGTVRKKEKDGWSAAEGELKRQIAAVDAILCGDEAETVAA